MSGYLKDFHQCRTGPKGINGNYRIYKLRIRKQIKKFLKTISVSDKLIIDWGAGKRPVKFYINHTNCQIITIDKRNHTEPDRVLDICEKQIIGKADMAFCIEVLEHCKYPDAALENISNNLKVEGIFILTVPFMLKVHSIEDYWRFTHRGIRFLLENHGFKDIKIIKFKDDERIHYLVKSIKKG